MDKKKLSGLALLVFFAIVVCVGLFKRHQFSENYKFTAGKVTEITLPGWKSSGDYSVLYEYLLNGKIYRNNTNRSYCKGASISKLKLLLTDKKFTVAYSAKDYGVSSILLTQADADVVQYVLPDSVKVYDSILGCK
ncbi:MAG: hypothetical protein ABIR15_13740 [Chitinophagaceae bacterium]